MNYNCSECNRSFDTEKGLNIHHTFKHKDSGTVVCIYRCCGKTKERVRSKIKQYNVEISDEQTEVELPVCRDCQKEGGEFGANYQGGKIEVECNFCSNTVKMWPYRYDEIEQKLQHCEECKSEWYSEKFTKEGHPRWDGGHKDYGRNWIEMREKVREIYNDVCQNCGEKWDGMSKRPAIHHINPIRFYNEPEDANKINNLIQLCPSCHHKIEKTKDSVEQMEMFDKDYLIITSEDNV